MLARRGEDCFWESKSSDRRPALAGDAAVASELLSRESDLRGPVTPIPTLGLPISSLRDDREPLARRGKHRSVASSPAVLIVVGPDPNRSANRFPAAELDESIESLAFGLALIGADSCLIFD